MSIYNRERNWNVEVVWVMRCRFNVLLSKWSQHECYIINLWSPVFQLSLPPWTLPPWSLPPWSLSSWSLPSWSWPRGISSSPFSALTPTCQSLRCPWAQDKFLRCCPVFPVLRNIPQPLIRRSLVCLCSSLAAFQPKSSEWRQSAPTYDNGTCSLNTRRKSFRSLSESNHSYARWVV